MVAMEMAAILDFSLKLDTTLSRKIFLAICAVSTTYRIKCEVKRQSCAIITIP